MWKMLEISIFLALYGHWAISVQGGPLQWEPHGHHRFLLGGWGSLVLKTIRALKTTSTETVRLLTPPQRSGWR